MTTPPTSEGSSATTTGAPGSQSRTTHRSAAAALGLRLIGALAILAVGAIHIQQYAADHYRFVPVIGGMFLLNFISAILIALLLLLPVQRLAERIRPGSGRLAAALPALGGIALAAVSIVFLLVSESTRLFGFKESGYRTVIYLALLAEALAVLALGGYLALMARRSPRP